ncbi:MAG TPA: FtsQ-type POTRA domain-containing protein [Mycobacteriales bacterium]|nr:FtsQ-type POTRA domain-containing protein [Mycobacteriales bacterium]
MRRLGVIVVVGGPLALLGWLLLWSPAFATERVRVTGTERLQQDRVVAAAAVQQGIPLLRVDTDAVRLRVAALAEVARVEVVRRWPRTVEVRITERQPLAGVLGPTGVTLYDRSGVAFARVRALPAGVVRLQVARPGPTDPTTRSALAVLAELPPGMHARVRIVRAATPAGVTLLLRDGRALVWGSPGDPLRKAAAAEALLRLPGQTFDVSRPGVVVRR